MHLFIYIPCDQFSPRYYNNELCYVHRFRILVRMHGVTWYVFTTFYSSIFCGSERFPIVVFVLWYTYNVFCKFTFPSFFFIFVQPIICIYVKYNDFMCKLSEKHILLERRTLSDWSAILIFLFVCQFWVIFFYFCLHFGGTYIRRVLLISYVPCYIFCFVFIFLIPLNQLYAFTYYNK